MPEEITLGELARLIERNHAETREDIASLHSRFDREYQAMNGRVDGMVSKDVYSSDQRTTTLRFERMEADMASFRATSRWAIGLAVTSMLAMLGIVIPLVVKGS